MLPLVVWGNPNYAGELLLAGVVSPSPGHLPCYCRVKRTTSCLRRQSETASKTTSFIRKGTLPVIAGKPPAATSQPSGMNGMMVTVAMKVPVEPRAPRTPNRLSQKPASSRVGRSRFVGEHDEFGRFAHDRDPD